MKLILTALNCSDSGLVVPYHCAGLRVLTGTPRQNWRLGARQRLRITLLQTNVNVVHKTNSLKFTNACRLVWLRHTNLRAWGHTEATVCTDLRFLLLCIAPFWTLFCTISPCRKHKVSLSFICLSALQPGTRPMTTSKLKNGSYTGCSEVFILRYLQLTHLQYHLVCSLLIIIYKSEGNGHVTDGFVFFQTSLHHNSPRTLAVFHVSLLPSNSFPTTFIRVKENTGSDQSIVLTMVKSHQRLQTHLFFFFNISFIAGIPGCL